jgi:catechol 2,3-dioxygenase-like lactoylglutathione lyase family enzyme
MVPRMLDHSQLFHIGIRVADLAAAMAEIGKQSNVTWASVQDRPMSVWLPGEGPVVLQLALTYSVEGPVHLELMRGPTGSIWDGNEAAGAHHFGYWSDDVEADTETMIADGWTLELAAAAPEDGYGRFTYVRSPSGYLVEPVSVANKTRFERWWAGGSLTDPVA